MVGAYRVYFLGREATVIRGETRRCTTNGQGEHASDSLIAYYIFRCTQLYK